MAHKKEINTPLSQEDNQQVQELLTQYHSIAQNIQNSTEQTQAELALSAIASLSEAAQIALLKRLAKEDERDAADVLVAVNAFSTNKEVRKEARRSLIRLEATKIYPQWTPPIAHASSVQVNIPNPPRFWKGVVTQVRDQGEVQLILVWEQGYDYSEARMLSFLLDYWQEGVKDVSVEATSKRNANERINDWRTKLSDVPFTDCTLAEAKRLIEEALTVNAWRKTAPYKDYRTYLPTINTLIMQASDLGEDRGRTFIHPELEDQEVAINFLGAWTMGDYGLAYDLLSRDSTIRDGLSRDEWVERHRQWADEAHPARLELGFAREHKARPSALWVPTTAINNRAPARKESEFGWSLELSETPLSGALREMPLALAVNKETGRHWFWTTYTLVQEQQAWRLQRFTDEGAQTQGKPIPELQKQIQEYEDAIQMRIQQRDSDVQAFMEEVPWRLTQLLHFYDALIARLPLDRQVVESAYNRSVAMGNPELTMVYLDRLAQRFAENKGDVLRSLAATHISYAFSDRTQHLPERRDHFLALAEKTLNEALTLDGSLMNHILLAELYLSTDRNDEAETELVKAGTLHPTPDDEVAIEAGLGNIAIRRERFDEAVTHFQRVTELSPESPGVWFSLGFAHRLLRDFDQAEAAYKHALQVEPGDMRAYSELIAIYMNQADKQKARRIAEQGIQAVPESAHLRALLASVLAELGETRRALQQLEEAEAIDPELEIVQSVRQQLNAAKKR